MVPTINNFLGIGVYTVPEAAAYARMHPNTLGRWLGMSPQGEAVLRPELPNVGDKLVTFRDFMQALSVRHIRRELNISLQKIRDAVNRATDLYGVDYPLARKHVTYAFGNELYIRVLLGDGPDEQFIGATGKVKNQLTIREIVELSMRDVTDWTPEGYALAYRAFQWEKFEVVMNPRRRFGEPIVMSCGFTAQALYEAFKSEGGFEPAAAAYGVEAQEVETAFRYFDSLDLAAA